MTFYDRYESVCNARGIQPCAQKTAELIGCTKSSISTWKNAGFYPKGSVVRSIAEKLNCSADFLLGLSEIMDQEMKHDLKTIPFGVVERYNKLDRMDQTKLLAYMDGLLSSDKYAG